MSVIARLALVLVGGTVLGVVAFASWQALANLLVDDLTAAPTTVGEPPTATTSNSAPTTTIAATTTTEGRGWLLIHGTGDVNTDTGYVPALGVEGHAHAWSGVGGLFLGDDLTIINLECAPADGGEPAPKRFVFRCDLDSLPVMAEAGVEVANLANNHSQDYGKEAMLAGRQNLISAGVVPVGVGKDAAEAGAPAIFDLNGWRVAVLGFGGVYPGTDWFATADRPGMSNGDDADSVTEAIRTASVLADLVIVTIHWGVELDILPRRDDVTLAEAMVAAGADAILGHHPHRLQPLDYLDGVPVAWSLGNFVWPSFSQAGSTTAVARIVVSPLGEIEACLIPALVVSSGHPELTGVPPCGPPTDP